VTMEVSRVENALAVREAALRFRPENAPEAPARRQVWLVTSHGLESVAVKPGLSDGAFTAIEPESPAQLPVGTRVALGVLNGGSDAQKTQGPGIKLGGK